ncbi:hypothetical protein [Thermosyntropha sp.]|uniref:hypothetical protein n=1 Tax=Thermosyntropha sp. TaxID=2740820 RepID=UPI0025F3D892|nr:hypothetical protein [Thermosyntropha sp.]MBO8159931.1 hypothetical protein [Thermosyntropha sp.]
MVKKVTPDNLDIPLDYTFFDLNHAWETVDLPIYPEESQIQSTNAKRTDISASYWKDIFQFMEATLCNGMTWDVDPSDISEENTFTKRHYENALQTVAEESKSFEEIVSEFDRWIGTPVDILSPYGDISWGENVFLEEDLTLEVPVKIYRKDSDYIVKANVPWIKVDEFNDMPADTKINLKSILAALPLRINSRQAKISFVNGELKLEVPKAAEK